jgi:hypothetical protein
MSELFTGKRHMWRTPNAAMIYAKSTVRKLYGRTASDPQVGLADQVLAVQLPNHLVETASPQLTLFAEASPVSPTPLLADAAELETSATYGASLPELFAKLDPDGSWRKTYPDCCQVNLDGSLDEYCETWPRAGMTRSGTAYRLRPLAAPHRRDRVWLVADAVRRGRKECSVSERQRQQTVSDAHRSIFGAAIARPERNPWAVEPNVGRVAHGIPARVERLRGLGNAIVPQIAQWIAERINEVEEQQ